MAITNVGSRVSPGVYRNPQGALTRQRPVGTVPGANKPVATQPAPTALSMEQRLRNNLARVGTKDPNYWQHRAGLNDYLESQGGKPVNRRKEEMQWAQKTKHWQPKKTEESPVTTMPGDTTPIVQPPTPASASPDPFRSIYDFALTNFKDSPLYKYQQQELESTLDKRLAKQRMFGSGAELEASQKAQQSLGAEWTDRIMNMASTDATRYDNQQSQAADAAAATQRDRRQAGLDIMRMMLDQNPFSQAVAGLGDYSNIEQGISDINAGTTRDNYKVVNPKITSGGGGGGGAPTRTVTNTGPDLTSIDLSRALAGTQNSNQWFNLLQNVIPTLF
jgi:hypothetical protein